MKILKKIKQLACLCLIGILMIVPVNYVSANAVEGTDGEGDSSIVITDQNTEILVENENIQSSFSIYSDIKLVTNAAITEKDTKVCQSISSLYNQIQNYSLNSDESMVLVKEESDTFVDGDAIIKMVGKTYEDIKADSAGYKKVGATYTWYVTSRNGSYQLVITLDVTFKRNGTYVYVYDKNYFYTVYNKHIFENISQSYTKKAQKSKTKAHYTVKGKLRNTENGNSGNYTFKITCTPSGTIKCYWSKS